MSEEMGATMTPEERENQRGQQRNQLISSVQKLASNSAVTTVIAAETLNLLDVQFRMEDALLVLEQLEATMEQQEPADLLKEATGHLQAAIPRCQQVVKRLVGAAQEDTVQAPLESLYLRPGKVKEEILEALEDQDPFEEQDYGLEEDQIDVKPGKIKVIEDVKPFESSSQQGRLKRKRPGHFSCEECMKSFPSAFKLARHVKTHSTDRLQCPVCSKTFFLASRLKRHVLTHSVERPFGCDDCDKSFATAGRLEVHRRYHTGEKPYSCSQCDKAFRWRQSLVVHMVSVHKQDESGATKEVVRAFECEYDGCQKKYRCTAELQVHMRSHTGERPFVCTECGKSFAIMSRLNRHMKCHDPNGVKFQCPQCPNIYSHQEGLTQHLKIHAGQCVYCKHCNRAFTREKALQLHELSHTDEKPFSCDACTRSFRTASLLEIHRRVHTGEKPYGCSQCDKSFMWRRSVLIHMQKFHWVDEPGQVSETAKTHACTHDGCTKKYRSAGELNVHIRSHTGERPYACTSCDKAFISRSKLVRHMKSHDTQVKYQCPHCPNTYSSKAILTQHLKLHTGQCVYCKFCNKAFSGPYSLKKHEHVHNDKRPFSCAECGKTFKQVSHLQSHMRLHSGDKFICPECPETFRWLQGLKKHFKAQHDGGLDEPTHACTRCPKKFDANCKLVIHMRSHTGERPFVCVHCGRGFTVATKLRRHMKSHTGEKAYGCTECEKKFSGSESLKVHMRTHTGERPYTCSYCQMSFAAPQAKRKHEKTHLKGKIVYARKPAAAAAASVATAKPAKRLQPIGARDR